MMKKVFLALFTLIMALSVLAACDDGDNASSGESLGRVGVSMPSLSLERWERDGNNIAENLRALDFEVDLQFAQDDVQTQISQIENMITNEVEILVVAPIDGDTLTEVLELAYSQGIPVIAYDRLIMNSEHVSYYVTFDNFHVGVLQGRFLVDELGLGTDAGPFNIELFAGSPDDNNARFFFNGAMSVLQPYIDGGELIITSGQTDFTQIAIPGWATADAQARMDNLLSAHYTATDLHAILSPSDSLALGIVSSLQSLGFGDTRPMPIITGQDADLANVRSILEGGQSMTVFKDTRILADAATRMVQEILNDESVTVNDTETYDNGVSVVPTYLSSVITVTVDNVQEVLVDTGFYTAEELGLE